MSDGTTTTIKVVNKVRGSHCWPDAPEQVAYLRDVHRHVFVFRTQVRVQHDERDIEFHMLQTHIYALLWAGWGDSSLSLFCSFGTNSCESLARWLGEALRVDGIDVQAVEVLEDDENGAEVVFAALPDHERRSL